MATHRMIKIPSIVGLAGGATAGTVGTFNLPIGYRYHKLELVYIDSASAAPTAMTTLLDDILIYRGTEVVRTHNAAELDRLNQFNGSQYGEKLNATGGVGYARRVLPIFFAEPWRKDVVDMDSKAWNVIPQNLFKTFQVTVKVAAGQTIPATGSFYMVAWVDDALPFTGKVQAIKKVIRQNIPASGLQVDVTTLASAGGYETIAMKHPSTGFIKSVTFKRDRDIFAEEVTREDNVEHLKQQGLNPADSVTVSTFGYELSFDADDPFRNVLVAQDLPLWMQLNFSAAAAGNVVALIERVE